MGQTDAQKTDEEEQTTNATDTATDSGTETGPGTGNDTPEAQAKTNYHVGLGAGVAVGVASNVSRAYIAQDTTVDAGSVRVNAKGDHVSTVNAFAGTTFPVSKVHIEENHHHFNDRRYGQGQGIRNRYRRCRGDRNNDRYNRGIHCRTRSDV